MVKKVILHIGHGKTGTSAIQSFLALNFERLEREGIRYPEHPSFDAAKLGNISSGNCPNEAEALFALINSELVRCPHDITLLFSNENMFWQREKICFFIASLCEQVEFEIILFIRDPIEMANSVYHQTVKRSGETRPFEEVAVNESHILCAKQWHEALRDAGIKTTLVNYSKRKRSTVRAFLKALGCAEALQEQKDAVAEYRIVNRSLGLMELNLVRIANREFGKSAGHELSDRLVEISPNVKSHKFQASDELLTNFKSRFGPTIAYFNEFLPEGEKLEIIGAEGEAEVPFAGNTDEEYAAVAAAFNVIMDERNAARNERDELARDAMARRSRLANSLDRWDYRLHQSLGRISFFGEKFQKRFRGSADRRYRSSYDK